MSAALRRVLATNWQQRTVLARLLWPASLLYGLLSGLRRWLYRYGMLPVQRTAVPVVVVGNVVAGGAGKTPVVMALVRHLQLRGIKAGVVSRGYGRRARDCREVHDNSLALEVGDEPLLIKHATGAPVFVAARRIEAANALLSMYPDVDLLVCDDGLQHYGLHRDIEICVFDERGVGNGFLLPSGPLREPWPRRSDLVLCPDKLLAPHGYVLRRTLASHARRADGSQVALRDLRGCAGQATTPLWAVAGIARPEAFFSMLRDQGLALACTDALEDHADFEESSCLTVRDAILICTEKDATKLWRHRPDALAVPLILQIEAAFWDAFDKLVCAHAGVKLSSVHGHTPP